MNEKEIASGLYRLWKEGRDVDAVKDLSNVLPIEWPLVWPLGYGRGSFSLQEECSRRLARKVEEIAGQVPRGGIYDVIRGGLEEFRRRLLEEQCTCEECRVIGLVHRAMDEFYARIDGDDDALFLWHSAGPLEQLRMLLRGWPLEEED